MKPQVQLEHYEILQAGTVGVMRHAENIANNYMSDNYGASEKNPWQRMVEGALAECALAKWLNLYWEGKGPTPIKGEVPPVDVGGICDARQTDKATNRLILHPNDPDDRPVFLVTGQNGSYVVQGWLFAGEGKKDEWWDDPRGKAGKDPRPAWWVQIKHLRDPYTFNAKAIRSITQ